MEERRKGGRRKEKRWKGEGKEAGKEAAGARFIMSFSGSLEAIIILESSPPGSVHSPGSSQPRRLLAKFFTCLVLPPISEIIRCFFHFDSILLGSSIIFSISVWIHCFFDG